MFNMWKRRKLWPWQWLTDGKVCIEHINALEVMDAWYQDVKNMKTQHQQQQQPPPPPQPKEVNN
jgi:hypothetical protein